MYPHMVTFLEREGRSREGRERDGRKGGGDLEG